MRGFFKLLGWLLIAAALALLIVDAFAWARTGSLVLTDTGLLWHRLHPGSLQLAEPAIARHVHPFLWHPIITSILLTPAFVVIGVLGLILVWATGGRAHRRRGKIFFD